MGLFGGLGGLLGGGGGGGGTTVDSFSSKSAKQTNSTSSQDIKNDTVTSSISGVVGDTYTGKDLTFNQSFGEDAANVVNNAISGFQEVVHEALSGSQAAIGTISDNAKFVLQHDENIKQPDTSITRDLIPLLLIASVGGILMMVLKK